MKLAMTILFICIIFPAFIGCSLRYSSRDYHSHDAERTSPDRTPAPHLSIKISTNNTPFNSLNLEQIIKIALNNNPDCSMAYWDNQAADAQYSIATAERLPNIQGSGAYYHYLEDQRLVPARKNGERGIFSSDIFNGDLIVKMPIFTGGRITNEIKAAKFTRQAAEHRLGRTHQELIFNLSSVFYTLLEQEKVIASVEFSKQVLEKHRQRVLNLIEARKAARVDLLRTEVRLAALEQRLVHEKNLMALQKRLLINLMGIKAKAENITLKGALALAEVNTQLEENLSLAYQSRPDYKAQQAVLNALASQLEAKRRIAFPEISLKGSYGLKYAGGADTSYADADELETVGSIGILFDVPLFEGGKISAEVQYELAKLKVVEEHLRKLEEQIHLEVETAILKITAAKEQIEASLKAVSQAEESLRIEREKYELSKGSITDVLDAQTAHLKAQTNYYQGLAEYNISVAKLRLAVGHIVALQLNIE